MQEKFTRKLFDSFLFGSFFMAICAVVMVYQTYNLLLQKKTYPDFIYFVFFSTLCSYNFHWMLTPKPARSAGKARRASSSDHAGWSYKHKILHLVLFISGLAGATWFFFMLQKSWFYLLMAAFPTFLYTAPKIPLPPFHWLKKVAIGKTIFLAMMWVYVTVALPVLIESAAWTKGIVIFIIAQFFFIFSICIVFDFRDREHDKAEHIISLITYLSERGIDRLFYFSVTFYSIHYMYLITTGIPWPNILLLLLPAPVLISIYSYAKKNYSDYLYYFLLDGLLMFPGLILWLMNRF